MPLSGRVISMEQVIFEIVLAILLEIKDSVVDGLRNSSSCPFPDDEPCSLRKAGLIFVESEQLLRADLAGDGDVEEIHRADGVVAGMHGAEFVGRAHGVGPRKFHVRPVTEADFVFEGADDRARRG